MAPLLEGGLHGTSGNQFPPLRGSSERKFPKGLQGIQNRSAMLSGRTLCNDIVFTVGKRVEPRNGKKRCTRVKVFAVHEPTRIPHPQIALPQCGAV